VQEGPSAAARSSTEARGWAELAQDKRFQPADDGYVTATGFGKPKHRAKTKEVLNIPPPILEL
jgi:hypothetical protein